MKKIVHNLKKIKLPKKLQHVNVVRALGLYRFKTSAIVLTAIVVFVVSNLVLSFLSLRWDLSKGHAYTLAPATRDMVADLEQTATVTLYSSNNIPSRIQPITREVIDLLREYERASGNINLQIVEFNPNEDVETVQHVQQAGIMPQPVRQQEQSEVSLTQIYFGIVTAYGEKQEVIPQALDVENLEYNLTSALFRLTREELPQIAVMGADPGLMPQEDPLGIFKEVAGQLFSVQSVPSSPPPVDSETGLETTEEAPVTIDPSYKTLLVFDHPETAITESQIAEVKKYLQTGNAIFFMNGVTLTDQLITSPGERLLFDLIKQYGIEVKSNLILSTRSEFVNMGSSGFSLYIPYPLWPWTSDFDTDAGYFSGIARITFPWGSSVHAREKEGFDIRELVWSPQESWQQTEPFSLNPQQIPEPPADEIQSYPLVAESKPQKGGKIMVVGSSRFLQNNYLSQESQNLEFMLNVLTEYASDGALTGIGSRIVNIYPLPELPQSAQEAYKYGNILLLPLLFVLYGGYRLWKRK